MLVFSPIIAQECSNFELCQFELPKTPISVTLVTVPLSDVIGQSNCTRRMAQFHWSEALFCPTSSFCGMGLDLLTSEGQRYSDVIKKHHERVLPVTELCGIIVERTRTSCLEVLTALYEIDILRGNA